jgi:hypothetical protein
MKQLTVLAPHNASIVRCIALSPSTVMSPPVLVFLQALSGRLLRSTYKTQPELVALGFWLRVANLNKLMASQTQGLHKALGLVLHFTPANVDTMFIYSWVCSLLMGNRNIIRVASSESLAKTCLLKELNALFSLPEFSEIALRNIFVTYAKESQYSGELSLHADARVIWGGDDSVNTIRALPCQPRCRDISFADRYSAVLINGGELNEQPKISELATLLWRDTQPHAQQACSSPRVVFWLGDTKGQRALFEQIDKLATQDTTDVTRLNNHLAVSQLIQSTGLAANPLVQKSICVLPLKTLHQDFLDWHLGTGLYLLFNLESVKNLAPFLDKKLQTLSYWQVDKSDLLKLVSLPSISGIDRLVPTGRALDFSVTWDGFDLLSQLSRRIEFL